MAQAEVNIGTIGHVDHGKTTLVQALTGKWADTHSEELKRGITIKLGYADVVFKKCEKCSGPEAYTVKDKCAKCGGPTKVLRKVSFADAPGHETLMATVIAASSIIDGAIFIIAANEACPQPQTVEHLMILEAAGIKNVVIAQNKVDLVTKEKAREHYQQIKEFLKGSPYENSPVIPTVANSGGNIDVLIQAIEETIKTPERKHSEHCRMLVVRSFDVNKPGSDFHKLVGGVIGGAIEEGTLKVGDKIKIKPGVFRQKKNKEWWEPLEGSVKALFAGNEKLDEAHAGGLIGVSTGWDPSLTHADSLVGCVLGTGELPEPKSEITVVVTPMKRMLQNFPGSFKPNEPLVLGIGTATTVGFVTEQKKKNVKLLLKKPVCVEKKDKIAVLRRADNRWRLYGTATLA